ncbi:META domain-containing protein [Corynebacterium hylobatis]|uniref:META domain-containing protein n=1 Tax=Corynebacterium hylobatis TaxID=1859290 RepID=A0A3S0AVG3_9CORY|nr:META domain-containing protein [Corynebacterium hylobatis]
MGRLGALAFIPLLLVGCATESSAVEPEGTWGTEAQGEPHLVLAGDGRVSGSDGCNRLTGTWELVDDQVELGPLASTMMACEGVETWLGGAETLTFDGDTMHVLDGQGAELGTLERQ